MTDLDGARFVDLYAGSGAVGLEALSRGASHVLLVESDQRTARIARDNAAALGAQSAVRVVTARVAQVLAGVEDEPYDVVFADPPYSSTGAEVTDVLGALVEHRWLAPDALVVVERSTRSGPVEWVPGITADGVRRYGETTLWYGRRS
jgi:16S rRNA (guanine(966)-N(2))-methyltransferase RsmD